MARERSAVMPRYFFNIVRGVERIIDADGIELQDDELVAFEWPKLIKEMISEEPDLFLEHEDWSIEIVDTGGRVVHLVALKA